MLLKVFCADRGQKAELARRLGIAGSTLSRICAGHREASIKLALRIEIATDGAVRAHEVPLSEGSRVALEIMRATDGARATEAGGA